MYAFLITIQSFLAISIIVLILLQHGKGASLGASFGAGAGSNMFGPIGAGNVLSRSTAVLVACFFTVSMLIAVTGKQERDLSSQFSDDVLATELDHLAEDPEDANLNVLDESNEDALLPPLE